MIVIKLIGGLGNQMFQYATAFALSKKKGFKLFLDFRALKRYKLHKHGGFDRLNITAPSLKLPYSLRWPYWLVRKRQKFKLKRGFYLEKSFNYSSDLENISDGTYIDGYFQSEKYFSFYKKELRNEFSVKCPLSLANEIFIREINSTNSVMIHVRRGDYVSNSDALSVHGICSLEYYKNAITLIKKRLVEPKFYVFSDDLEWCKSNLELLNDAVFVSGNERNPEVDIWLMTNCRHHIIANSSFSWWGAWLAKSSDQVVIAPIPWFDSKIHDARDLCPEHWIRIAK